MKNWKKKFKKLKKKFKKKKKKKLVQKFSLDKRLLIFETVHCE